MNKTNGIMKWIGGALLFIGIVLLIINFPSNKKIETNISTDLSTTETENLATSTPEEPVVSVTPIKPVASKNNNVSLKVVKVENGCTDPELCKAPIISDFKIKNITNSGVIITWTTDQPATTEIFYKKVVLFSDEKTFTVSSQSLSKTHEVDLGFLDAHTNYSLTIKSTNSLGFSATSTTVSFTTLN